MAGRKERRTQMVKFKKGKGKEKLESCKEEMEAKKEGKESWICRVDGGKEGKKWGG